MLASQWNCISCIWKYWRALNLLILFKNCVIKFWQDLKFGVFAYSKAWMRLILADFNLVVYFMIAKFLNLVHRQIFQNIQPINKLRKKVYLRTSSWLPINEFWCSTLTSWLTSTIQQAPETSWIYIVLLERDWKESMMPGIRECSCSFIHSYRGLCFHSFSNNNWIVSWVTSTIQQTETRWIYIVEMW